MLKGNEVKAVRAGNINLSASYAVISGTQLSLVNCHISSYSHAYTATLLSEDRSRILLAHRHEIKDLICLSCKSKPLITFSFNF